MNDSNCIAFIRAARDICIFFVFVAILVTSPIWAAWIDGKGDYWEKAAADHHAQVFARLRSTTCE